MSKNKNYFPSPTDPMDTLHGRREDYRKAVIAKLEAARALQIRFATAALQNGAAAEDLPVILASAMKDGSIPQSFLKG